MRGDHTPGSTAAPNRTGPPPRARGPRIREQCPGRRAGTTPACAGTTLVRKVARSGGLDHPRVRGDHPKRATVDGNARGPPPRARGPLGTGSVPARRRGTTPACAGATRGPWLRSRAGGDHPRVRGDHRLEPTGSRVPRGPPPRARGPPGGACSRGRKAGTTPACAGTTRTGPRPAPGARDHPRVRGDHPIAIVSCPWGSGPPPRARGPHPRRPDRLDVHGTTPACAGTTWSLPPGPPWPRDHPRVRGDHLKAEEPDTYAEGPPPRARGPHRHRPHHCHRNGTTPACAGTTDPFPYPSYLCGDHPRVRGDHWAGRQGVRPAGGPPPRARGPPRCSRPGTACPGTTPACAGTTCWPSARPPRNGDHPRVRGDHFLGQAESVGR